MSLRSCAPDRCGSAKPRGRSRRRGHFVQTAFEEVWPDQYPTSPHRAGRLARETADSRRAFLSELECSAERPLPQYGERCVGRSEVSPLSRHAGLQVDLQAIRHQVEGHLVANREAAAN